MKKLLVLFIFMGLLVAPAMIGAQTGIRFATLDIYLDSQNESLAAWQFELTDSNDHMQVVGIENGEHPAYSKIPGYDRDVVDRGHADRIIVASFSLDSDLPKGPTRVASIHVRLDGEPEYQLRLINAGNAKGVAIPAAITWKKK